MAPRSPAVGARRHSEGGMKHAINTLAFIGLIASLLTPLLLIGG